MRKLSKATVLSFLALIMASGITVVTAAPAMATVPSPTGIDDCFDDVVDLDSVTDEIAPGLATEIFALMDPPLC
jgi:hypothetical protein